MRHRTANTRVKPWISISVRNYVRPGSNARAQGGAAMAGLLWSAEGLGSETPEPSYGPAPQPARGGRAPLLPLSARRPASRDLAGGTAKEANATGFPVSDKLAGVYMTLEPGALRELHWHANAAEWAYVIEGRCRVTTIDPENQAEVADFGVGDVWYFPRGHGHSIQGASVPAPAPSSSCSTTATSRSSGPSRSSAGSATRQPRLSPRISIFPLRPSRPSRRGLYRQGSRAAASIA